MTESKMTRYWINTPSRHDMNHAVHGKRVIAPKKMPKDSVTIYFAERTEGFDIVSMVIDPNKLSKGWPKEK